MCHEPGPLSVLRSSLHSVLACVLVKKTSLASNVLGGFLVGVFGLLILRAVSPTYFEDSDKESLPTRLKPQLGRPRCRPLGHNLVITAGRLDGGHMLTGPECSVRRKASVGNHGRDFGARRTRRSG